MNDKEKQIREIAKVIMGAVQSETHLVKPANIFEAAVEAEALYNTGYRKIPENSVVLLIEEFNELKGRAEEVFNEMTERMKAEVKIAKHISALSARKETVIELSKKVKSKIKELKQRYHEDYINGLGDEEYNGLTESDIDELLKEMGVD